MSSAASDPEPTPQVQPNPPFFDVHLPAPEILGGIGDLPAPIHIYDIPVHLRRLVTLDLTILNQRTTTTNDIRDFIKCFYNTIPRARMETKVQLIDSFFYYVVPIIRAPHVFNYQRGIFYSFDVPFNIELQEEPGTGEVGNNNNNTGTDQDAA